MGPKHVDGRCLGCMEPKRGRRTCPLCGWDHRNQPRAAHILAPGTVIGPGHGFQIGRDLGQGGFGITYLGWDLTLNRKVAIKEYYPRQTAMRASDGRTVLPISERWREEFEYGLQKNLEEGQALAQFQNNPVVVPVLHFFKDNGASYLVMKFEEGRTFERYLQENGEKIGFEKALRIVIPIMEALANDVHKAGVLHRDISPDNIFITNAGAPKLIDFGNARKAMRRSNETRMLVFKDCYSPIEQTDFRGEQGPWTDVYAMAATLYKAITGRTPPSAPERAEAKKDPLVPPSRYGVAIPPSAERALLKALAIEPSHRYRTMSDFRKEIHIPELPPPLPDPDPPVPWWRYARRALAAVAVLAVCGLLYWRFRPQPIGQIDLRPEPAFLDVAANSDGPPPERRIVKWNGSGIQYHAYTTAPWLSVSPADNSTLEEMELRFDTSSLRPGPYSAEVHVSTSDRRVRSGPGVVTVRLVNSPPAATPHRLTSQKHVRFDFPSERQQTKRVELPNHSQLTYTATPAANWLRIAPNGNGLDLSLTGNAKKVGPGPHETEIHVTPANPSEPDAIVSVYLNVVGAERSTKTTTKTPGNGEEKEKEKENSAKIDHETTKKADPPPLPECDPTGALPEGATTLNTHLAPGESVEITAAGKRSLNSRNFDASGAPTGNVRVTNSDMFRTSCAVSVQVAPPLGIEVKPTRDNRFRLVIRNKGDSPVDRVLINWKLAN